MTISHTTTFSFQKTTSPVSISVRDSLDACHAKAGQRTFASPPKPIPPTEKMDTVKRVGKWLIPKNQQSEDGRDQWPSRTAFLLASVGGAVGQGNIIRYPSQVFNNIGLQWFIPYLIAIFILAIPTLILEVSIGQTYRGGPTVAWNRVNSRAKGVGFASMLVSMTVVVYFAIILVWIAIYFRHSFTSPLPWTGRVEAFYNQEVLRSVAPVQGDFYYTYPGTSLIGETVG